MKKGIVFFCVMLLVWTSVGLAHGQPQAFDYSNTRYGFSLHLPPWFYVAQEADNGDGILITDPTTLEIRAYGSMVINPEESLEDLATQWGDRMGLIHKRIVNKEEQYFILEGVRTLPADSEHAEQFTAVKVFYGQDAYSILFITYYGTPNKNYPHIIETALGSFKRQKP